MCEVAFDALALLAAGIARVVGIFGVQGWRWDWVREVRELVFALDADAAGQQHRRQLARQVALRGKRVAGGRWACGACWDFASEKGARWPARMATSGQAVGVGGTESHVVAIGLP